MLAQFVLNARHCVAGRFGWHQERADAALASTFVGYSHHNRKVGILARRDELFGAVEHVMIGVKRGRGAQAGRVGACMCLGQRECAEHFTARQRHQPIALLLLVGEAHQDRTHRAVVNRNHGAHAAIARCNFFKNNRE